MNNPIAQETKNYTNDQMIADKFRKVSQSEFMNIVRHLAKSL